MKKLLQNNFVNSILYKLLITLVTFLTSVIVARLLGPENKGIQALIINVATWLSLVLNFGVHQTYTMMLKEKIDEILEKLFQTIFFQFFVYAFIAIILLILIDSSVIRLIVLIVPFITLLKQLDYFAMIEDIRIRNKFVLIRQLSYLALLTVSYFITVDKLILVLLAFLITYLINILMIIYKFNILRRLSFKFKLNEIFNIISKGFIPMISILLINSNYNLDIILLSYLSTDYSVGIYSISVLLVNIVWLIPDAFKEVIISISHSSDRVLKVNRSLFINLVITPVIVIGFIVLGQIFIDLIYGLEYSESYLPTAIIMVGTIPMLFYKMIRPLVLTDGRDYISNIILVFAVSINILGNLILIPEYDYTGAAISSLVSYSVCGVSFWVVYRVKYKQRVIDILKEYKFFIKLIKSKEL